MRETIRFRLNGRDTTLETEGTRTLLWVLRQDLGLTGVKFGCGISECGACTVLVDGNPIRSCAYPVSGLEGTEVLTIEGLAQGDELHPLQEEFAERGAFQCGYCTPGMIMEAYSLLARNPHPTRSDILRGMEGNLCRCAAHKRIVEAIEAAAARM
ncbi:MAG: (2Fe-2S)-binding protein [Gemmatimonadota bacterium]|jgi:aerobic-type carbon monoxide dehydrogenase small subunit (CoxS/CutS family)